jgi:hypothetical protein
VKFLKQVLCAEKHRLNFDEMRKDAWFADVKVDQLLVSAV